MINKYSPRDLIYVRLIRRYVGESWAEAKPKIVAELPPECSPDLLDKFVDERPNPGIHINKYGFEPRFYPHRKSGRLLEFYRSVG